MDEIEYAITNFEEFLVADIGQGDLHICSAETALTALREQAEREKGCEYCRGNVKELVDGDTTIFINHEDKVFYADWSGNDYLDWKHCPMCGRRLEAEHD